VILGVGELCHRKDFATLIRAFARLTDRSDHRLVILGEGRARARLDEDVHRLNLTHRVLLPVFVGNPYPYKKAAGLFVLSSLWEGLGGVIVEALAAGTAVVATDRPSGPRELLAGLPGDPLAEPGDDAGLAEAMARQLAQPPFPEQLHAAVSSYGLENSVPPYLAALGVMGYLGREFPIGEQIG
jgi:glycosyltransferase involved in cell wall biosynthesis